MPSAKLSANGRKPAWASRQAAPKVVSLLTWTQDVDP
jgi:hypothetical protein